ncbi:MAG: tetratricopeptide repeat protein [Bryobacteraceae bacterium]|nr:tetratricopeptide repeat protein [Bryobacteraceae bacterium]
MPALTLRCFAVLLGCAAMGAAQDPAHGIALFHKGEYAQAKAALEKAPAGEHQRVFLALSRAALGECKTVADDLGALFQKTSDADLRRLSGIAAVQCYVNLSRFDDALPVALRLKQLYPADADVLYQSARALMRSWNDVVFQMFQKTPASFRVNQLSAEIFEIQGRYGEAIQEYGKAIEKNPRALNLHFRLGRAVLMNSHAPEALEAARKEFEAELALNPGDAVAEYQVALILQAQQKGPEATARLERAVALNPEFPEALQGLAKARMEAKRPEEAIRLLEQVVRLQPSSESAHYALMVAYRNAGRREDAARQKATLDKLRKPPEGEFTEFLKRIGEKPPGSENK